MKKVNILLLILIGLNFGISAQMVVGNQKLYGNEWIDYSQTYVKIPIAQDGIYRLTATALQAAGIPLSTVAANRFQLFKLGQEVPIFTSTEAVLGSNDYIEFFGERNRGELDAFMYKNQKADMLNPEFSLTTDTAVYFLTWRTTPSSQRFQTVVNNLTNLPAKEAWFWHTEKYIGVDNQVSYDISGGSSVYLPEMNTGEGTGTAFGNSRTITLNPQFMVDGQDGTLSLRWTGNYKNHYTNISASGQVIARDTANGYTFRDKTYNVASALIKNNMPIQIVGGYEANDNHSLGVATLEYVRQFNFGAKNQFVFKMLHTLCLFSGNRRYGCFRRRLNESFYFVHIPDMME